MYLLDANACIEIINDTSPALVHRLRFHNPSQIRLCSVVKAELLYGARKSARPAQNLRVLQSFFAPMRSLPFDDASSEEYGSIRAELERAGRLIGVHDMMIAAIAMANDVTLVTHNVSEFSRVAGLKWEDWEEAESPP
ncbi:MAG TPA: type II toxin-antitoxin system VapC family toxin [Vicinamibacteria bacterium]|nr:type II toxin-antitoxin system VapC family toxin [Vicinamibacteria bacterium]